jgi:hypothetical protein
MPFTNEPAGSTLISDFPYNSKTGTGTGPGVWNTTNGNSQIVADSSAPESPSNVLQINYPVGFKAGSAPDNSFVSLSGARTELFVGLWWKANAGWQQEINSEISKIFFFISNGAPGILVMRGPQGGPYSLDFGLEFPGIFNGHIAGTSGDNPGTRNFFYNSGSVSVFPGNWYKVEMYTKFSSTTTSRNGILRWWVNNTMVGNYTNVNYDTTRPWNEAKVSPTWGGGNNTKTQNDWFRYDHIRVSLPNSGVIVQPPPPPTISSFTPTSGTFGTPITIVGTNFDSNPSGNSITLNNTSCTVLGATTTQLNTAVPNNATTGRIRVTTGNGNATSANDFVVQDPEPTGDGLLIGSRVSSNNTILSNEGTLDWAHWGLTVATSFNHKSGANLISDALVINAGNGRNRYASSPTTYTWVSGTPTASATSTPTGIFTDGTISFTVPADTTERILRVYGGCFNTPSMRVRATLNDNSAASYTDTGLSSTLTESSTNAVWTLRYKAGSANKLLTVDISLTAGNATVGNVALQAATLQLANAPTESITLSPANITVEVSDDPAAPGRVGTLTLSINPARSSAAVVTFTSSDPSIVAVAESVTIPANTMTAQVTVTGIAEGSATITATLGTNIATSTVTVVEAPDEPEEPTGPATPSLNLYTSFLDVYRWM